MTSVRLRLLVFALIPMILVMPFLLFLSMSRWTSDYDDVLIANVESDLRIAEQYLARIMQGTSADLTAIAGSAEFEEAWRAGSAAVDRFLARSRVRQELDFLYYLPANEATEWPVIERAFNGQAGSAIDIFEADMLLTLDPDLAERARIDLIETQAAVPTERTFEDRGMIVHAAAPVQAPGQSGALVGGILLNHNLNFIDTINALVYLNAITGGDRQGTATLFLDDVRVSTNVRLFEDVRALGTRVSAAVRGAVLDEGQTWLARAFVVNDWYISGYLPLEDSFGNRVGMLYVGFLEAPFSAAKRDAFIAIAVAFAVVIALSAPVFLWLAKGIFSPLERMTQTMNRVGQGDLSARNGDVGSRDEIGQVASHLDRLLDDVQDRDQELRGWADELNQRVEARTVELREANTKLEETFKQLVVSEKLASIGEITAGVAHEINNPVAVIQGNVDVIRDVVADKPIEIGTELDLIDNQVTRIDAIVGKLLQFARPGEFSGMDKCVDPKAVVADCLILVDHLLSKGQFDIQLSLQPVDPVQIDPGEMQQVVVNLLMNALQAMGDEGTLMLELSPTDRDGRPGICLRVADTGPGLP